MDRLLLLRYPTTPISSQCRPSPLLGSIHFAFNAGRRKRRRRITGPAMKKALRLAISLASSFRSLLSTEETSLDLFLLYGGAGGRRWRRPGGGTSRSKMISALLVVLALASAVVRVGGRSPERDLVIRALVPVILGMGIADWKRWVGLAVLWITLYLFAVWSRRGRKRFGWR